MKETLLKDLKQAMLDKDIITKNTIQSIRASILQEEKDKQIEADDKLIENILLKEKKKRVDALEQFEKANREDLINQTKRELTIIEGYLPQQLTREEVEQEVDKYMKPLSDITIKEMGPIIKDLKNKFGSSIDGKMLSEVVREKILNK